MSLKRLFTRDGWEHFKMVAGFMIVFNCVVTGFGVFDSRGVSRPITHGEDLEAVTQASIDVNESGWGSLTMIHGVGSVKAKAIVAEREDGGLFDDPDDLARRVSGISPRLAEWIFEQAGP